MSDSTSIPDLLPVLSRGKHRNPRKGACFMELASYLAGERWSDRPACTHALLAEVARNTNDRTSDAGRPRLAPLIPSVVGLFPEDPRTDARVTLQCALTALPVAPYERQRSLAVGVLACRRQLHALGDDDGGGLLERARQVLEDVPDAGRWAVRFSARSGLDRLDTSPRHFRRFSAPSIVALAARSLAEAAVPSSDDLLVSMLEGAIEQCRALAPVAAPTRVDQHRWQQAAALTR